MQHISGFTYLLGTVLLAYYVDNSDAFMVPSSTKVPKKACNGFTSRDSLGSSPSHSIASVPLTYNGLRNKHTLEMGMLSSKSSSVEQAIRSNEKASSYSLFRTKETKNGYRNRKTSKITMMKGTVSPNDQNDDMQNSSIISKTLAKLWNSWFFRFWRNLFTKIFRSKTKLDEDTDSKTTNNETKTETDSKAEVAANIMGQVEETSKKVEEINNKYLESNLVDAVQSSGVLEKEEAIVEVAEETISEDEKDVAMDNGNVDGKSIGEVKSIEKPDEAIDEIEETRWPIKPTTVAVSNDKDLDVTATETEPDQTETDGIDTTVEQKDEVTPAAKEETTTMVDEKVEEQVDEASSVEDDEVKVESTTIVDEIKEQQVDDETPLEAFDEVKDEVVETPLPETKPLPKGNRWAVSAPDVDLSAVWKIVVDDKFKEEYDSYLKNLGQPSLVRSIAVNIVELTTEEVIQGDNGRTLTIKGKNLRGVWERTLLASGSDYENDFNEDEEDHDQIDLITADKEKVKAEAWWEGEGTVHRSYLRGVKKYGGGDFESKRYLEDDGNTLICESIFHPKEGKEPAVVKWTFKRT